MWLSQQLARRESEASGEISRGKVTIGGDSAAVMLQGERRELATLCPAGMSWSPAAGDDVVVLQSEDGERFIIGTVSSTLGNTAPGEVILKCGGNSIHISENGIELKGSVIINGVDVSSAAEAAL